MELRPRNVNSFFALTSEIRHATNAGEIHRFTTLFDSEMPRHRFRGALLASATGEQILGPAENGVWQNMFSENDPNAYTAQVNRWS